jgi:hypothetical protein
MRSIYSVTVHPAQGIHWPVIAIVDVDRGRSVTNDAANIFAKLIGWGLDLDAHRVIYRDSTGTWDELLVGPHGSFGGFGPLGARTEEEALEKLRARNQEDWDPDGGRSGPARYARSSIGGGDRRLDHCQGPGIHESLARTIEAGGEF